MSFFVTKKTRTGRSPNPRRSRRSSTISSRRQSTWFARFHVHITHTVYRYTKALDNIKTLRKDRVADLKVEKERLEGIAREKRHADKLRSNAADLTASIASKQVELDETQRKHAEITLSNKRFVDQASHFREIYIRAETAAKNKDKLEEDLKEALSTIKEVDGA